MKCSKQLISILLALGMVAILLPVAATAADGVKKIATTISTVPQYIKEGETYISNDGSGASGPKSLNYGTDIYFLLRTAAGSAGNIKSPDYVDPADYTVEISGAQGVESGGLSIVTQQCVSGDTFWYLKVELIDQGSLTTDTTVSGTITVTPSGGSAFTLSLAARNITLIAATSGTKKVATTISTVPQYVKESETYISNDGSGASTAKRLNYGTDIYFLLRTATGSAGNIQSPDYVDPADYTLDITGAQGVATDGLAIISQQCVSGDTFWYLKVKLIDQGSLTTDTAVQGTVTVTPSGSSAFTLSLDSRNITLIAVTGGDTPIITMGTQAQALRSDGYIGTMTKTECLSLSYGQVLYYPIRTTGSANITGATELTPSKYTCAYTKSAAESFNAVASVEMVYAASSASESRWWLKVTLIDAPASPPASMELNGTFGITATTPATDVSMAPKDYNYPLAIGTVAGAEKIVTRTSTAPQYIAEGETLIAQNGTSSSASYFPYGQTIYFILRDDTGDIISPDYIVPADYTVDCTSAQVVSAELVKGNYSGGERWYVKLVFIDAPTSADDTTVEGVLTITHNSSSAVAALSLTLRGITLSTDSTPRPFTRIASWAQRMTDGVVSSISGASTTSPTVNYGERIYYALANGADTTVSSASAIEPDDYQVTYTPHGKNNFNPFESLSLVYESYATSTSSGTKWFVMLQINDDAQGLQLADGIIAITRITDSVTLATLDLADNIPLILGGEDDTVNSRGVRTVTLVHHIASTKLVESEDGYVGRATSDLGGISSNVAFGETAYYMLFGQDKLGGQHPISDLEAVKDIKIKNKLEQNADKVEKIEIIKKRSLAYGYSGYYYFLAITFVDKPTSVTRYTVMGDIVLEGKGKYGINTPDNTCEIFIDTVVGPEKAAGRIDTQDEQTLHTLSDTYRRFSFDDDALGSDKEDELFFYGMSDDNYFIVDTRNQDDILLGNTVEYNEAVGARFPGADLFFFNGSTKEFNHHGVMTFTATPGTFLYARNGNELSRINGLKYDEEEAAFKFLTKKIGSYVFSNTELDYDRYNIDHIAVWAQAPNADGSLSTISGASNKSPTLEYGSTVYYALRNSEDKGLFNQMALDPAHFTFGLVTNDPNAPAVKTAGLAYRTNWIKSTDSRSDKYYVAVTFAEVPDPGVLRKVSGDFVIYYKGDEVTRLKLGPTEAGDFTLTLHGGRPVENDWIPADYVAPVLKDESEIEQAVVTSYLNAENENDGDDTITDNVETDNDTNTGSPAAESQADDSE